MPSQPAYGRIAQSQFHQTKTRDNQVAARDSYRGHVPTFGDVRCDTPVQGDYFERTSITEDFPAREYYPLNLLDTRARLPPRR